MKNRVINVNWNTDKNHACVQHNTENNRRNTSGTTALICAFVGVASIYSSGSTPVGQLGNNLQTSYIQNIKLDELWTGNMMNVDSSIDLSKIDNINKIKKMKEFESNWNGHGAPAFSDTSIALFLKIINTLSKQPKIAPTGKAGLLMQYEAVDKSLLAFNISEKKIEQVYVPQGDYQQARVTFFENDFVKYINESVEWFNGLEQNNR